MFTANFRTRPSRKITLHRLILNRSEEQALRLLNSPSYAESLNAQSISANHISTVCLVSSGGTVRIPPGHLGIVRAHDRNIPTPEFLAAVSPHPFEMNGSMQDALQLAASYGLRPVVENLLTKGANPNHQDGFGRTALHYAAQGRHNAIVSLLIENGARIDLRDSILALPFNAYLISSKQAHLFDPNIIALLQIDYLQTHQEANGKLRSENMDENSPDCSLQKHKEAIDKLRTRADRNMASFGCEFYQSRRELREPNKNLEFATSRETLIIMVKVMIATEHLSDEAYDLALNDQSILYTFQFLGVLVTGLAKEVKSPYQGQIPWDSITFLASLFSDSDLQNRPEHLDKVKHITQSVFPIIRRKLNNTIHDFQHWLERNQNLVYVPPYRQTDLLPLYNFTDYFHDLRNLKLIVKQLECAQALDPQQLNGRRGLIQLIKVVADLAKYQHSGRNLSRTLKEKLPLFPWNEFGELRDKLAKISISQENTVFIQDLLNNNPDFFVTLKAELGYLLADLKPILMAHQVLSYDVLGIYYQNEPKTADEARSDLHLYTELSTNSYQNVKEIVSAIITQKTHTISEQLKRLEKQMQGIQKSTKLLPIQKKEKTQSLKARREDIQSDTLKIKKPFEDLLEATSSSLRLTLEQQRFILSQLGNSQERKRFKETILQSSRFKNLLTLESNLRMKSDCEFTQMDGSEKAIIIDRTDLYLGELIQVVIPDENMRNQLMACTELFEPGNDEFGSYLIEQYNRISSNPNQLYGMCFLAIEVQQSLRFLGLKGNTAFRIHLEHDEHAFDAISPNRLQDEINEILRNLTEDYPALRRLKSSNQPRM